MELQSNKHTLNRPECGKPTESALSSEISLSFGVLDPLIHFDEVSSEHGRQHKSVTNFSIKRCVFDSVNAAQME